MKIGAVRESWLVLTPVTPPAVHGLVRRNEKPQQLRFPLSNRMSRGVAMAVQGGGGYESPWDEKPYETLPTGKKVYVDESDVVTFLDPPKELIPLDPASYNPAAYLWLVFRLSRRKKIEDIPEERRHRLLQFLEPRLITRAWEIAGARYEDPKLAKMTASKLFSTGGDAEISLEYFNCRTSNGPLIISWIRSFKMAVFSSNNGQVYGRICGGPIVSTLANAFSPLYFEVTEAMEVMATEEPCDIACRFGDGLLAIEDYPQGFPRPAKHPYPFNDSVVIYIRHIGPGVCVGQAWQEGKELQQSNAIDIFSYTVAEVDHGSHMKIRVVLQKLSFVVAVPDPSECDGRRTQQTEETLGEAREVTQLDHNASPVVAEDQNSGNTLLGCGQCKVVPSE
ncbi:hypothetical protein Bca101_027663 [Brassica carinata]